MAREKRVMLWSHILEENYFVKYSVLVRMVKTYLRKRDTIRAIDIADQFGCTPQLAASVLKRHLFWKKISGKRWAP